MMLPSFIGIGAQRAATTWVYECLRSHPEIFMPKKKELHFFNHEYENGVEYYSNYFVGSEGFKAVGEITPNYINNEFALERIAKTIPNVKLFLIIREPISRAYSAYRLLNEKYGNISFEEACSETEYFLKLSLYSEDIKRLLSYFDRSSVCFFIFEDIIGDPKKMLKCLYGFIGVSDGFIPSSIDKVYNPIVYPNLQRTLVKSGLGPLLSFVKDTRLGEIVKKGLVSMQKPKLKSEKKNTKGNYITPEFRLYLRKYFEKDIIATQKLIDRDLSMWLK